MKIRRGVWQICAIAAAIAVIAYLHFLSGKISGTGEEEYTTYELHYAMITDGSDDDFWDEVYESALEEGKQSGVYVERFGSDLAVEYSRNELLKLAAQAGVDGIIVPGDEDEETIALLDSAVDSGIPVVTVLTDSTGSIRQCFVGNNNYTLGQDYGTQIAELLTSEEETEGDASEEKTVLVLLDEDRADTSQNLILLGIREMLALTLGEDYPVSVNTTLVDNTGTFTSEESIRDIFLSTELPDIMVCLSSVHTLCAYQAAVDYNEVGNVQILGYYDTDTILEAVEKEIISATITLDTEQMGQYSVRALNEYISTGYTNNYMAVDTYLINAGDAADMLAAEQE